MDSASPAVNSQTSHLIQKFLAKKNVLAVVGASLDPTKYGHKVYLDLLNAGYKVYPVHPDNGQIAGRQRYRNLADLPQRPDVVCVVVPPAVALKIVKQAHQLGIHKIWLQPGSESQIVLDYCRQHHLQVLSGMCIMVKRLACQA